MHVRLSTTCLFTTASRERFTLVLQRSGPDLGNRFPTLLDANIIQVEPTSPLTPFPSPRGMQAERRSLIDLKFRNMSPLHFSGFSLQWPYNRAALKTTFRSHPLRDPVSEGVWRSHQTDYGMTTMACRGSVLRGRSKLNAACSDMMASYRLVFLNQV